jgi:hypothetical protein
MTMGDPAASDDGSVTGLTGLSVNRPHARDVKRETRHNPSPDPLPLADRVRKARHEGVCTVCKALITTGQAIAHLSKPPGWCHIGCAPAVADFIRRSEGVT